MGDDGLPVGSGLDRELVDLALSVNAAAMWSFDLARGEVDWMSGMDALLDMPGATQNEVRARLLELIRPMTVAAGTTPMWQDLELEQPLETPGGEARLIRFRARRFGDARTGGLLGIATGAAESDRTSRELADIADRYRLLVELSPDAICVHQKGVLTYVNPATVSMVAAESDTQIIGCPITDFVSEESLPGLRERVESLTKPGETSEPSEAQLLRLDGGTVLVEAVSVRTTWKGRPAFQVIMHDVTAQRAAEATLHYQAALVEHVSDAIIATTRDGVVTSWNPAAEAVYGVPAHEARGQHVGELVGAPLEPAALLTAGGVTQTLHRRADGSKLIVRVSAAEMDSGFVLMCADETARRRAEQHFATVVDSLDEGVVVIGEAGLIVSANPAARNILGFGEDELVGLSLPSWPMFDERGNPIPLDDYPSRRTQRTGEPQNSYVARLRRPDGQSVWLAITSRSLTPDDDPPHSVLISFIDITEHRAIRARLEHEATHDPLTGLANRTLVLQQLSATLRSPHRAHLMAVLFIDLDNFKVINDSLGHIVGDRVLQIAGERLRHAAREGDLIGRLGGDEFVVVAHSVIDHEEIRDLVERLRDSLSAPIDMDGRWLHVDASTGIVLIPSDDGRAAEDILRDADVAMYQAKYQGHGHSAFFGVELRERVQRHMHLEQDLRSAVQRDQLWLAYQPIVDLRTDRTVAVEGLLRWTHPVHGNVSPGEFIPVAEESGLINLIGAHMLRTALSEFTTQSRRYGFDMQLKANLSARQLEDPHLLPTVRRALVDSGMSGDALCLEITESALMRDSSAATRVLNALRELGVFLAIDDFGTGYSSLAQLQRLPLDTLKIDRSFVARLGESEDAEIIITSIIAMAHAVRLTVVAEGAETAEQLDILRRLGCDQVQGFYLAKPSPLEELFAVVRSDGIPIQRPTSST
ncbi:PAS domain S-box-containing protein/diguanylate cyclase (GGDEF)-like protein [Halopolyspora algeriensis]|uniref:PAS domain S-box-containing protein/diguanylate cyclase (GGDEF)-like protein n=1 Tax=Halopolyspora algeriensis TaxID=1500506 RepID=A0A368VM06_9ACTN|nr:EAL domain-containing protein [Halopolyspora algeriensis]RCW40716.1 PAS domain S-box-containing protein/diguanylate cyclase (GGDEF)-like protein [Halopolyspora algeriensis]TQM53361.1 PAS domain S-box-containing protein/diguanylate cyclase (GGDEF)-like protein [Halopolyspora algeriensis]